MYFSAFFLSSIFCTSLGVSPTFPVENAENTRILYIRHGEVPGNDPNPLTYIYTGCKTDDSLTEKGRSQAEQCAHRISNLVNNGYLQNVTAIYASDLKRAQETAEPIAEMLGLDVEVRHDLREIDWGCADGQLVKQMADQWKETEKQIKAQYSERKILWDHLPVYENAETYNTLLNRNLEEIKRIAEAHKGETVLIIGHGRVLKTLIAESMDSEANLPYPANCGIAEFIYSPEEGLCFTQVFDKSLGME